MELSKADLIYKRIYDMILETRTSYQDINTEIDGILSNVAQFIDADFGYIGLVSRTTNLFFSYGIYCKDLTEDPEHYRAQINTEMHVTESQKSISAWVLNHEKPVLAQGPYEEYCRKIWNWML